jgi:cathepsin L
VGGLQKGIKITNLHADNFIFTQTPLPYLQTFGKSYENDMEELRRNAIWQANKQYIEAHNANADKFGFELGMNVFGDLESQEVVDLLNGYKQEMKNSSKGVFTYNPNIEAEATVDWREKGAVTGVKNQGQCGSCWSFSATGSLEGQHFLKEGELVSLSEQNLIDCSTKYGNHGCKGGAMRNAFRYIEENRGIDTERSYPYQAHDELCRFSRENVGATDEGYVPILRDDEKALTQAVQTVGPISVAIDASKKTFHLYKRGVYYDPLCSSTKLDHGVLVVGYGTMEEQEYYIVKNSWGPLWGDEGYVMMSRNKENNCGIATQASYPKV